jgi:hypothetical protein
MNAIITISSSYGFDHNWSLNVIFRNKSQKSFYLGQDCKFIFRVLNCDTGYVVRSIGTNNLQSEKARKKLARFIINHLELNEEKLKKLQPWELCCQ